MRKKTISLLIIIVGVAMVLAACGSKSQEKVTEKLVKTAENLTSYQAKAEMKMNVGQDEQAYDIDISHMADDFYRVELANKEDEQESQVILKNEDGVFVLTPALNKSFKFQTEWPENSSQAYLYQSLINDILQDPEATFEATDDYYVFETKANYQSNNNMPNQEIYFDKKNYTPIKVKVLDKDQKSVVEITFTNFELDVDLSEDDFEVDDNMEDAQANIPVIGEEEDDEDSSAFEVLFPLETLGAELANKQEVDIDDGTRILMEFAGDKNYTLIQEKSTTYPTNTTPYEVKGDIVNLGFTVGSLTNDVIEWSHKGVDFMLASDELTQEELLEVAQSVQGKEVK